ncbi:MAG TPA: 2-oxoglutarate dehydrogenase E1 component, partial [Hyphomonadaceae bacterium]|nr:2-oxoglutarate dehydrogenase E1 component [Hyphomonadaceae bacterium]
MADDGSPPNGNRSDANSAMLETLFLYGGNASYIEQLQAKFDRDPNSVPPQWRSFFESLGDAGEPVSKAADGPSWTPASWPLTQRDENTDAIDYSWSANEPQIAAKITERAGPSANPQDVARSIQESIKAIMMIRAYRMRGHLGADLDPLRLNDFG